jgi:uncharacterized membrane protein/thiol-disulfide isomerase/thioredoxin
MVAASALALPMINRLILWLSLLGMVLAVHLWIQKARDFDQGCLGLSKHVAVIDQDCQEVGAIPASHLLGVSNAAWGYAFYFALALTSFAKLVTRAGWARRLHLAGEIGVAGALLYSGYLVYEMGFVAHAWCVLCLTSATMVFLLAVLHGVARVRGGFQPLEETARAGEFRAAVGAVFAAAGVFVGVLLFVDRLGTRPLDQGSTGRELLRIVGGSLPYFIDEGELAEMRACHFEREGPTIVPGEFTGPSTPYFGNMAGPEVVVFYDPNCPHCREYHAVFQRVMEKFRDRAHFAIVPRLLWKESARQAAALKLAEPSGKYFELWRVMFERQPGPERAMTVPQIEGIFAELGLDTKDLALRLAAAEPVEIASAEKARAAGIDGAPMVFIGGRKVWGWNRSEACIGTLIGRVADGQVKPVGADTK